MLPLGAGGAGGAGEDDLIGAGLSMGVMAIAWETGGRAWETIGVDTTPPHHLNIANSLSVRRYQLCASLRTFWHFPTS